MGVENRLFHIKTLGHSSCARILSVAIFMQYALPFQSVWAVRYMEFDERIKELISEINHISLATYRSQLIQKVRDYLQLEKTAWTVWNPEGGEIGFDMYWPFHWDDLKHLSRLREINLNKYVTMASELVDAYMPNPEWNMYDYYYTYKPSNDVFNWIPPFKSEYWLTICTSCITV